MSCDPPGMTKIAVLGTGDVGKAIASKLVSLGHEVRLGSRTDGNEASERWAADQGEGASVGTFADAAAFGEMVFLATSGVHTFTVAKGIVEEVGRKILVDVTNPLDFSQGFPPALSVCNKDSLAEQIQRALPEARVIKTLNTVHNSLMIAPRRISGDHQIFVSGNDADAKAEVSELLQTFGWRAHEILDLGDVTTARGTEMWLPLWVRLFAKFGTGDFNITLTRVDDAD